MVTAGKVSFPGLTGHQQTQFPAQALMTAKSKGVPRVLSCFGRVQLFATLWTGYSVHGVLQTRILEWFAMSSSRGSF